MTDSKTDICCPKFNPEPWDKTTREWTEKPFLVTTIPQFFHMPLPFVYGKAIKRLFALAEHDNILPDSTETLLLAHDPSPWKSELYLSVTETKPDLPIQKLTGLFATRVFDGPYEAVPSYIKETDSWLAETNKSAKKYYLYYTTCPKCAKKYGHNYIVTFAEL